MENLEVKTCWFIGQFSYGLFLCRQSDLSKWQLSIKEIKENQRGDDLAYKVGIGNGTQWVQFLSEGNPFWRTQSRASKFSFLSINSISYEIWYLQLKFETLLVNRPKVKVWASGGRRSGQGPGEQKKVSHFCLFRKYFNLLFNGQKPFSSDDRHGLETCSQLNFYCHALWYLSKSNMGVYIFGVTSLFLRNMYWIWLWFTCHFYSVKLMQQKRRA